MAEPTIKEDTGSEVTVKVSRNGGHQTVTIPLELGFSTDTVTLEKRGDSLLLRPKYPAGWDRFFADESLVLPQDFEAGDELPLQERTHW
ncbi:MAG: hypothetical protein SX243_04030 [Acidobacteriota bacterium]|nr:hypothetical protein [Acidobacteriota bacterium]